MRSHKNFTHCCRSLLALQPRMNLTRFWNATYRAAVARFLRDSWAVCCPTAETFGTSISRSSPTN